MNTAFEGAYGGGSRPRDDARMKCRICRPVYDHAEGDDWQIPARTPFSCYRITRIARRAAALASPEQDHQALYQHGLSQLQAARGLLCHRVKVKRKTITRYRILAPTEWNFGSDGAAAHALECIAETEADPFDRQARLLVHAIDPCVGFTLHVEGEAERHA